MSNSTPQLCPPPQPDETLLNWLGSRRSPSVVDLCDPGPNPDQLHQMLALASRTPDHGKLVPWRFVVFSGEGRVKAGDILAQRKQALDHDLHPDLIAAERQRFLRVPVVVGCVYSPKESPKIPIWEQQLAAGALCMNLLHAARAMGFGAKWLSEWYAFDREVLGAFGLQPHEDMAGYIYIGTQTEPQLERKRPNIADLITSF